WYYASGNQQMGPVDDAALDDLVRQGLVRDDTLVWRQGMSSWQPHGTARPRAAVPASQPSPAHSAPAAVAAAPAPSPSPSPQPSPQQETRFCSNCGRPTPVSQLTTVNGASICAACLPSVSGAGGAASSQPSYQAGPGYQAGGYQPAPSYGAPG